MNAGAAKSSIDCRTDLATRQLAYLRRLHVCAS